MVPFSPLDDCIDSEDDMTGSEQQVKDDDKDDHVDQQSQTKWDVHTVEQIVQIDHGDTFASL
ncbi:TPA: hypothetical protein ACH3X2_001343 [Trebouxia sp. C0005]